MKRLLTLFTVAGAVALVVVGAGLASANQNANGSISVSPTVVPAGGAVRISGSVSTTACPASDDAIPTSDAALFPPDGFGPATSRDSGGAFALTYTVPASTPAGTYTVGLRCGGGNVGVSATLQVTVVPGGAPAAGAGGAAGGTGRAWTIIGLSVVALGSGLVALRRKLGARAR